MSSLSDTALPSPGGRADGADTPITVNTFAELLQNETAIVARIARVPNGGQLFLLHPFRLFADLGVKLAPEVVREILQREPELSALSDSAYAALQAAPKQRVQFHLKGLFRGTVEENKHEPPCWLRRSN